MDILINKYIPNNMITLQDIITTDRCTTDLNSLEGQHGWRPAYHGTVERRRKHGFPVIPTGAVKYLHTSHKQLAHMRMAGEVLTTIGKQ